MGAGGKVQNIINRDSNPKSTSFYHYSKSTFQVLNGVIFKKSLSSLDLSVYMIKKKIEIKIQKESKFQNQPSPDNNYSFVIKVSFTS